MSEITPSLADSHIIRTYPRDYAASDTESEGVPQFEVETEDEEQNSISTRLEQNQRYMDQEIAPSSGESSAWLLEAQDWKTTEGSDVVKPTERQSLQWFSSLELPISKQSSLQKMERFLGPYTAGFAQVL